MRMVPSFHLFNPSPHFLPTPARYDPYIGAMTDMYAALSAVKNSPMRLVLGPWTHGDHGLTYAGDVDFGPQATFDRNVAPTFHVRCGAQDALLYLCVDNMLYSHCVNSVCSWAL